MLENKTVMIKWGHRNKNTYENKGYNFTKHGDYFEVKIEDLTDTARGIVDVRCDGCETILKDIPWEDYKRYVKEDGKYYCKNCAANGYKKWISFYEWCYLNLSKELADYILSRWDYDLNIDKNGKIISPKDITYGSAGFNKKGYWFKCLDNSEHKSEQKSIIHFTTRDARKESCNQCNTISVTHPEYTKFFVNKEDTLKYSAHSNKSVLMKCPNCKHEKMMNIHNLISQGFACPRCSDGISYPEKFIFSLFEQICVNFKTQLNNKIFSWCSKYKYDNYIRKIDCIIELHGMQHYEEVTGNWKFTLQETQNNDFDKEWLAKLNKIKNYIVIDCRYSDLEWIKNSIMRSNLPKLLNFKESNIDWLKCHESGYKSLVKIVSSLWQDGTKNVLQIAEILKIGKVRLRNI